MEKTKKLRKSLENNEILRVVGAHNGMGAKIIEKNGFDGVWASGLEISTSYALPDASILTMTEFLNATKAINNATNLPVIADCDTGYGNVLNVIHMVKEYETAGIAAVCIEDKKFPKVNSFVPGRQELAPTEEFVDKIRAAKDTQQTKDFMLFARVEALIAGWSMEEALKRARMYADAGADGIFIHSKSKTPQEIIDFVEHWDRELPLIICPTKYPSLTFDEIKMMEKIHVVIYANHGVRAQIRAMNNIFSKIHAYGTTFSIEEDIATLEEVFEIQGMPRFKDAEKQYIRTSDNLSRITITVRELDKIWNSKSVKMRIEG